MARRRTRGDGSVFQLPNGKWRAQVDLGIVDGRRSRKTATRDTQAAARRALREMNADAQKGITTDRMMLNQWLDYWLETIAPARVRDGTLVGYRNKLDRYVRPLIGHVRLDVLEPEHIERVHRGMRDRGLAEKTVTQVHAILRRALAVAEQRGRVRRNPAALVELPQPKANPRARWTVAESRRALAGAAPGREWLRLSCGLMSAMRPGEVLGLLWEDVHEDAPRPHLIVTGGLREITGQGLIRTAPKSARSMRVIPLWDAQVQAFAAWRQQTGGVGYVFAGADPERPTQPKRDWIMWGDMCTRLGVPPIPPAGARASGAVLMAAAGVPMVTVQGLLGHADVATTARYYAIADDEMRIDGVRRAEVYLSELAPRVLGNDEKPPAP